MDKVDPVGTPVLPEKTINKFLSKFKKASSNFKSLPVGTKKLLSLGMVVALLIALPIVVMTVVTSRIFFFNRAATGETIEPPYTPTPTPACKTGLNSFSVDTPCTDNGISGFRYMTFECYDGFGRREGSSSSCKSSTSWRSYAEEYCQGHSNCTPTPTPGTPTPTPRSPTPTPKTPSPTPRTPTPKTPTPTPRTPTPRTPTPTPRTPGPWTPAPTPNPYVKPVISTTSLPTGRVNRSYAASISGYENVSNAILSMNIPTLPKGISKTCIIGNSVGGNVTTLTCYLRGTPLSWGIFRIPVTLYDGRQQSVSKTFTLTIFPF